MICACMSQKIIIVYLNLHEVSSLQFFFLKKTLYTQVNNAGGLCKNPGGLITKNLRHFAFSKFS